MLPIKPRASQPVSEQPGSEPLCKGCAITAPLQTLGLTRSTAASGAQPPPDTAITLERSLMTLEQRLAVGLEAANLGLVLSLCVCVCAHVWGPEADILILLHLTF